MSDNHRLLLRTPSSWWGNMWREALPTGNGTVGAAVYGGVYDETILFNHAELWHGGKKDPLPDVSHTLREVRKLIDEGHYKEANDLLSEAVNATGYDSRLARPLPLGDLKLSMPNGSGFRRYRRVLDMETGVAAVSWQDGTKSYERLLFVSRADDMAVYEIRCAGGRVDAGFRFEMHDRSADHPIQEELRPSMEIQAKDGYLYYAMRNRDEGDFGAVVRVIPSGGAMTEGPEEVRVTGADSVLVLVKLFVRGERHERWGALRTELEAVRDGYEALLARHTSLHKPLFHSASLSLGGARAEGRSNEELLLEAYDGETPLELIEKMWAFGRYLFISGTRDGGQPLAMYGLWGGDYDAIWAYHMANENIQMIYWHAAKGGLLPLSSTFFDYFEGMLDDYRDNARKLYGCRGIYVPAGSSPGLGAPALVVPIIMNWTAGAGWLARHYYEYYLYTGDMDFLKRRALPFMREAALFYEDFLVEEADGSVKFYPSVSPENTPGNLLEEQYDTLGHALPTTMNATMDAAIAKELLQHLVEGSRAAGMYSEELGRWERLLAGIPPYGINEDGAVKEWLHADLHDNYLHRHQSHLYPVFPGDEITMDAQPELFRAFSVAVEKRLVVGLNDQSGWSLMHAANTHARLGQGDRALECLELLSRSCLMNNLYTLHNDWRGMGICLTMPEAVFQTDANMGFVSAVQEMLMFASVDCIRLLPACPEKWTQGEAVDFRFQTGRVSMKWDFGAHQFQATLCADRNTELTLYLPEALGPYEWHVEDGSAEPQNGRTDVLQLNVSRGGTLRLIGG